ncbi:MAG: hypothetical protein EOP32_12000 [Rhodococcus sp. (in: high G+C Gram-positive bacteria)]|nr:MAG: hypothetical protein EOP32_12000 [Rhodococcus sp. (in: high G+C Gram-positive bacteria)]
MTKTYFQPHDFEILALSRVTELADDLRMLGLLDSKELGQLETALDRAEQAQAIGAAATRRTEAERADIAEKVSTGELDIADIRAEAAKIPEDLQVIRIAESVYSSAVREAQRIAYAHTDQAPKLLNEHLDTIVAEAAELAGKLEGVLTADQAIARGVTDEWTAVADLAGTYSTLRGVVSRLREAGRLAKPGNGEGGPWWNFRTPPQLERGGYRVVTAGPDADGGRAKFLKEMASGPYVPASSGEALAVMRVHDEAQLEFQTGGRA